ncbi:MAG: cysteine hydrolase family protein [Arenicellales bacterium WSBS_2016_MAG_OTU3]
MMALPFGPLDKDTVFVCIDMQRLFLEPGEWYCESALDILPVASKLAEAAATNCVFTRFITAENPEDAQGRWQHYYKRWRSVTRSVIGEDAMELHDDLLVFATQDRVFDKTGHDAFSSAAFSGWISNTQPGALVLFGVETDVCVLATAMSAVDLGLRVIIVTDALASSDKASHDACLRLIYPRFEQQIELVKSGDVMAAWSAKR